MVCSFQRIQSVRCRLQSRDNIEEGHDSRKLLNPCQHGSRKGKGRYKNTSFWITLPVTHLQCCSPHSNTSISWTHQCINLLMNIAPSCSSMFPKTWRVNMRFLVNIWHLNNNLDILPQTTIFSYEMSPFENF